MDTKEFQKLVVATLVKLEARIDSVESDVAHARSSPDDSCAGMVFHEKGYLKELNQLTTYIESLDGT